MKIILEQALHSLTRRKLLSALIIIMMTVGLFLIIGSMGYAEHNEERVDDFYSAYPEDEYRFFVNMNEDGAKRYEDGEIALAEIQKQFQALNNAGTFDFMHFTTRDQWLEIYDPKVGDNCLTGYQQYNPYRDFRYIKEEGKYTSSVNAYSVDGRVFDRFRLRVAAGRDFSDFDHKDFYAETIPIVCGWEWSRAYKIGDTVQGIILLNGTDTRTFQIVGFLEPGISILPPDATNADAIVSLDTYVLAPYLDCTYAKDEDADYFNISCLFEGIVFTKTIPNPAVAFAKQTGMGNVGNGKRVMMIGDSFKKSAENYFDLMLVASILILASSTLCLSLNLANKLMASFKTYAIHLISGGTIAKIKLFMLFEVLVIMVISDIAAFICAMFFGGGVFTYNEMGIFGVQVSRISPFAAACAVGVSVAVSLVALAFPLIKLSVVEYDTLLRGKE